MFTHKESVTQSEPMVVALSLDGVPNSNDVDTRAGIVVVVYVWIEPSGGMIKEIVDPFWLHATAFPLSSKYVPHEKNRACVVWANASATHKNQINISESI